MRFLNGRGTCGDPCSFSISHPFSKSAIQSRVSLAHHITFFGRCREISSVLQHFFLELVGPRPLGLRAFAMADGAKGDESLDMVREDESVSKSNPKVGQYSLTGLALTWDNCVNVRQRMRDRFNLVCHYDSKLKKLTNTIAHKTVRDAICNDFVLVPVCQLIRKHGVLPCVDKLAEQVKTLYSVHTLPITLCDAQDQAWAIRHLIGVVKNNIRTDKYGVKRWPKDCPGKFSITPIAYHFEIWTHIVEKRCIAHHYNNKKLNVPNALRSRTLKCNNFFLSWEF